MSEYIVNIANRLAEQFHSRDPFAVAEALGIHIWQREIGSVKGLYNVCLGERYIVVNSGLPEAEKRIVCAHELGHDQINPYLAGYTPIQDTAPAHFDMRRKPERQANIFAAEFLIADEDILSNKEYTIEQMAKILATNEVYVKLKLGLMAGRGKNLAWLAPQG